MAGFYKYAVREYKNILILPVDRFETRKKQGDKPVLARSNRIPHDTSRPGVSLLRADCLRDNRSFLPDWA